MQMYYRRLATRRFIYFGQVRIQYYIDVFSNLLGKLWIN